MILIASFGMAARAGKPRASGDDPAKIITAHFQTE